MVGLRIEFMENIEKIEAAWSIDVWEEGGEMLQHVDRNHTFSKTSGWGKSLNSLPKTPFFIFAFFCIWC